MSFLIPPEEVGSRPSMSLSQLRFFDSNRMVLRFLVRVLGPRHSLPLLLHWLTAYISALTHLLRRGSRSLSITGLQGLPCRVFLWRLMGKRWALEPDRLVSNPSSANWVTLESQFLSESQLLICKVEGIMPTFGDCY